MKRKIKIRCCRKEDLNQLIEIDNEIWPNFRANKEMILSRINFFPEGQFLAEINGKVAGSVFTQKIRSDDWEKKNFTWLEITDNGTIKRTHRPDGDTLYGVGLAVKKEFQGQGISYRLIIAGIQLAIRLNLKQILLGSRVPSYHRYFPTLTIEEYLKKGYDPEIFLYRKYGGEIVRSLPNYMPDPPSLNYGVLVRWKNPFYRNPLRSVISEIIPYIIKYI